MRSWLLSAALAAVLAFTLAAPLSAQRRGNSNTTDRVELERRLRENFERTVRDRLDLTEVQATQLADVVLAFQQERLVLQRRESDLRRRLQGQVTSARRGGALLPEAESREVLSEMRAIQNAESELINREHDRLLQVLTPPQLVRYYLIREQLAEILRRVRGPGALAS